MIRIENGSKEYIKNKEKIVALKDINYTFEQGKFYGIVGHSGSGKSTLLHIIGLLDELTSGSLWINEQEIRGLGEKEKAKLRMKEIGFIFQSFYLNPRLKASENIMLPMFINPEYDKKKREERVEELLEQFQIKERKNHFPKELSGGEQQRIAIARALANNPNIILADEPTGNLDKDNEEIVLKTLKDLSENGKCVIMVTHNEIIQNYADIVLSLEYGVLRKQ